MDKDVPQIIKTNTCFTCGEVKPLKFFPHLSPEQRKEKPFRDRCNICRDKQGSVKKATLNDDGSWTVLFNKTLSEQVYGRNLEKVAIKEHKKLTKKSTAAAAAKHKEVIAEVQELNTQRNQLRAELEAKRIAQKERRKKDKAEIKKRVAKTVKAEVAKKHAGTVLETEENRVKQEVALIKHDMVQETKALENEIKQDAEDLRTATQELAQRELARRFLIPFICRMQADYDAGWVHKDLARRLEKFLQDVIDKKAPRLMIQMPPRLGKSTEASDMFPSWALGKYPWLEFIQCTYSGSLATAFSRKVRGRIRDDNEYQALFPKCRVDKDNANAEGWMTTEGGGYIPAGVGGGITGRGAHILVIDDPVKNAEEAESATIRESTDDWYKTTAYTRLAPGGGVLVIQTRWHLDDLSGRLESRMKDGEGDDFEIVRYPAVATQDETYRLMGEALHPARYDEAAYVRIKRAVGPRVWTALYQQNPVGDEMQYFDPDGTFVYYEGVDVPDNLNYYSAWDLAVSTNERSDWTVGIIFGVDKNLEIWVLDLIRFRKESDEIVESILDNHEIWDTELDGLENGHIRLAIGPFLEIRADERGLLNQTCLPLMIGKRDKEARARPIQAMLKQRRVHFPARAHWLQILIAEMLEFPFNTKNDDTVDTLAWIGQMILSLDKPVEYKKKVKGKKPTVKERLDKIARKTGNAHKSAMSA